jgi:hypothetical protein
MQTNILWAGIEYHSLENCLIDNTAQGTNIYSTIVGMYEEKIYKVDYQIQTNQHWETLFVELKARHSNRQQHLMLEGDTKGNWTMNGKQTAELKGCIDVDIPLTPFTNTLPINRLRLQQGAEQEISVVYLDILQWKTHAVHQKYIRLSDTAYHYENVPNDFEATIETDAQGFVIDYPSLFNRSSGLESSYH